jgi:hypothetical protein
MIQTELLQAIIADRQRDIERELQVRQLLRRVHSQSKSHRSGEEGGLRLSGLLRTQHGSR